MGPTDLTGLQARDAVAAGEISADELTEAWREAASGDQLNAFMWRASDEERQARAAALGGSEPSLPPVAVKDIFCTTDIETTACSRILEGYRPPYTATAVTKLLGAGAPMLGKTGMDEFAMGSSNENSAYGNVLNPWDHTRVPGGSSGGSAAAVAGGLAAWSIGTDTGGSIRQPASLCGIVGLKPTYGAISRYGMIAFASSLDQAGPLTRDVRDAALLLSIMQGLDHRDSTSVGLPAPPELPDAEDLTGLRFAVPSDLRMDGVEAGVKDAFKATLAKIEELGGVLTEVALPHAEHGISAYYVIAPAEASANLARFDGVRYGQRTEAGDLTAMYEETRHDGFGNEVKRRIMLGTYALSSGFYEAYYGRALKVRTKIAEDFRTAFSEADFIVTPTSPSVAFELGSKTADPLSMYLNDYFTVPMSLAGIPAISIPCGLAQPDGGGPELPVGFQIASAPFTEPALLNAAHALEKAIGFDTRPEGVGGG